MSDFILADGSASISGELSLLAEKEYTLPLSKKDTTESLKTALYELLMYADTVKNQNESIVLLAKKRATQDKLTEATIEKQQTRITELENTLNSAITKLEVSAPELVLSTKKYRAIAKGEKE